MNFMPVVWLLLSEITNHGLEKRQLWHAHCNECWQLECQPYITVKPMAATSTLPEVGTCSTGCGTDCKWNFGTALKTVPQVGPPGPKPELQVKLLLNKLEPQLKFEIYKLQTATLASAAVLRTSQNFGTSPTSVADSEKNWQLCPCAKSF